MDSISIQRRLDRIIDPNKCEFLGVFPRDLVPPTCSRFPCCYVSNTDPSNKAGSHWVAFFFVSFDHCEFFDSFAMPPSIYGFHFQSPSVNLVVSKHQLQSNNSNVCGQFCIYFLYSRSIGHPFSRIIRSMCKDNLSLNDTYVSLFLKKLTSKITLNDSFHTPHSTCPCFQTCTERSCSHI